MTKTLIFIWPLCLLISSCKDNNKSGIKREVETIKQHDLKKSDNKKHGPISDLIYESENLKLYGDTTIEKDKISYASIKFEPYISFDDFSVNTIDHKKYAELNLKSNKVANNFRTKLKEGYSADTANFAGHYTFVYWGCGSTCQSSLLIDRKTGEVYDSPGASLGFDFRVDSRMLIINPPDTNDFYDDCFYCKPIIYIFDEQTKTFKERHKR